MNVLARVLDAWKGTDRHSAKRDQFAGRRGSIFGASQVDGRPSRRAVRQTSAGRRYIQGLQEQRATDPHGLSLRGPPACRAGAGQGGGQANEIVAIPKLLDMLALEGAVVTIDAMGCQRTIAQKVMDKKADYIFALKGNQSTLRDTVELFAAE
jgi:hypothetical protein